MNKMLNKRISSIPIPPRVQKLPVSPEGYPVPWFVQWMKDGKPCDPGEGIPDFRVMDRNKFQRAISYRCCWVCGETLGSFKSFVIGPMCTINRISSEPPSHFECAEFSVHACPFLTKPRMRRNENDLPEHRVMGGIGITRNPGVSCIWITKKYSMFQANGILFNIGDPSRTLWYSEGRPATREEVLDSIETGYPDLEEMAREEGENAMLGLIKMRRKAMEFVPA